MLQLHEISRSFGDRQVLTDVSFTVHGGRMTGFVGGNGAGKTTTMRIILGVLSADSGTVTLDGTPLTPLARSRFGYMPEERGLYPKMKISEQLIYLSQLHGMSAVAAKQETEVLLERLGLGERANDTLESLSLGNQQRAQIAAALVHRPTALVLDEPFSGLDPMAVETVLSVLREAAAEGVPVLFSSHQLDIVERLCDDVVVIGGGRVLAAGSREELRAQHSRPSYLIEFSQPVSQELLKEIHQISGISEVRTAESSVFFDAESQIIAEQVLQRAVRAEDGAQVVRFAPITPSLAEIFQEVVR